MKTLSRLQQEKRLKTQNEHENSLYYHRRLMPGCFSSKVWVWYALGTGEAAGDELMKWCVLRPHENSMCKAS